MKYIQDKYIAKIKWVTLELRVPKEVFKTPKAMEQVFASLHAIYSFGIKGHDRYFKGKVEPWMSFEMVGRGGGVHFYVRTPVDFRNLVESAIFAQYPSAEINEVDDYVDFFPIIMPNNDYEIWGTDFILSKEDVYPIKTYPYFEDKDKEKRLDPLAPIVEAMSKLKGNENIWLQFIIKGAGDATHKWKKKGEEIIDKMLGKETKGSKKGVFAVISEEIGLWIGNFFKASYELPNWDKSVEKKESSSKNLSHGEQDKLKAMENKLSQLSFEAVIRFIYIDKKDTFSRAHISSVTGAFKQFAYIHLNSVKANLETLTGKNTWLANLFPIYKKRVEFARKRKIWDNYRLRIMLPKTCVFSVEELATLYHIPSAMVEAPKLRRLEAKKGEPPEGLPIETI
ncbi:MAG: hypothetical protein QMD86_02485 [Patescibacteria group bacterium]|nr:hypothetical protein [Patescibacteria group bacterium]